MPTTAAIRWPLRLNNYREVRSDKTRPSGLDAAPTAAGPKRQHLEAPSQITHVECKFGFVVELICPLHLCTQSYVLFSHHMHVQNASKVEIFPIQLIGVGIENQLVAGYEVEVPPSHDVKTRDGRDVRANAPAAGFHS